jgi:hypothetical protein
MSKAICTNTRLSIPECSCGRCHLRLLARHGALSPSADRPPVSTSTPPVRIIGSEQRWHGGYRVDPR